METSRLKKFAQFARRSLIEQVGSKLAQVLKEESPERRELPQVVAKLEGELKQKDKEQLIEQVAYVWFNRFCALRFMDVNSYNRIGVLSPAEGQFQPEILAEAKAGHIDEGVVNDTAREKIFGLLNGSILSRDGQSEAYRLLIVAVCNDYHRIMPYLFERIEDYTELLMPDDLLSGNSILAYTREAMTPEACESVECIGWLYQFYISEKKDKVFEGLKNNKKITPENIPAATQLFTPHWIVRYLVENSLGRLWMLNNPSSKVIDQMDYYIKPVEEESDYLKISSPEEIKVCDPACGSGHMLTYAYDLLYAIYLDAGYDPVDIPELILTKNLYGIEIDERAAELAAFALSMKALKGNPDDESNNRRRFFRNPIKPNICRLKSISIDMEVVQKWQKVLGESLVSTEVAELISQFEEANNFGSLIKPVVDDVTPVLQDFRRLVERSHLGIGHPDRLNPEQELLVKTPNFRNAVDALKQADYLSQKYHVVVANPPYMGGKGMNPRLGKWLKDEYSDVKADLFSAFMFRVTKLTTQSGYMGFVTPYVWMFISSYEKLRNYLLKQTSITSLIQLEYNAFSPAMIPVATFTIQNSYVPSYLGNYIRLSDFRGAENQPVRALEAIKNPDCGWLHHSSADEFNKVPGSPIAYWVEKELLDSFSRGKEIGSIAAPRQGLATSDNDRFLRFWFEVALVNISFDSKSRAGAKDSQKKWFPYNKGGAFRKWYGNNWFVINWENDGKELLDFAASLYGSPTRTIKNIPFYFKESITWSALSSGGLSLRYNPTGFIFDTKGQCIFAEEKDLLEKLMALLNSSTALNLMKFLAPTLDFNSGVIAKVPYEDVVDDSHVSKIKRLVNIAKQDWDNYEVSWGFKYSPLLLGKEKGFSLKGACSYFIDLGELTSKEVRSLEQSNNELFASEYNLNGVVDCDVNISDVTLFSNAINRYGKDKSSEELYKLQINDAIRDFCSYSVGCMFGRYALDIEGLVLSGQGDTLENYLQRIPQPSFIPDEDNVIPMIDFDGDWFEDDISGRFKEFLKVTFGEEHFAENLAFVEEAIGKDIKKYFVKDFYADHVKRYKKRPIYWLFSSPKGSFNTLIYMHRYRPDTVSVVLNDYLREFRTKLQARKESYEQVEVSASASQKEKTQAIKAIDKINKVLDEVNDYERDILYPLAGQNKEIDLDDGVKHNYPKFGKALKKIAGLS